MKNRCGTCPTIGDCKTAFGRYWTERSHGGAGCDRRFQYRRQAGQRLAEQSSAIRTGKTIKQGEII